MHTRWRIVQRMYAMVFVRLQLSVYKQFLEILHNYEDQQSSITEVDAPLHSP